MNSKDLIFLLIIFVLSFCVGVAVNANIAVKKAFTQREMYFCTAADNKHFRWLLDLIGSIHKTNFNDTKIIAVFDLGFTIKQRKQLSLMQKVQVFDVERTHPDLLTYFQSRSAPELKMVRGWYAWKPAVIKQALEKFPHVLYLDAGCLVLKPLNNLFLYIQEKGYCLFNNYGQIRERAIRRVASKFANKQDSWILDAPNITAGPRG